MVQNHSTPHYSPSFGREIRKFEACIFWAFSKNVAIFNQSRLKLANYNIEKMFQLIKYIKIGKKCEFLTKNQVFKKWWIMLDLIWRHLLSNIIGPFHFLLYFSIKSCILASPSKTSLINIMIFLKSIVQSKWLYNTTSKWEVKGMIFDSQAKYTCLLLVKRIKVYFYDASISYIVNDV